MSPIEIRSTLEMTPTEYATYIANNSEPYNFETVQGNLTLPQFYDLFYRVMIMEQPDVITAPAYPPYLIPGTDAYDMTMDEPVQKFKDTITYKVTRMEPASIGGNKQPFGDGQRELTPKLRRTVKDVNKQDNIYGQFLDTLIQYDVWSLTNKEAEDMSLWFFRFMARYRDFFKEMGLSEMLFWWRGEDNTLTKLDNKLHYRTLVYYARIEEILTDEDGILNKVQIKFLQ